MRRAYAEIPEGQIHYRTAGTGPPLLLLHQSVCSSDEYTRVIPILSKDYMVIAMDTPGYGESDKPPRPYEIPDYARSVVTFLDSLHINKTSVAGHHTGADIAVELAAMYPERVDKLVLSGCPFSPESSESLTPDIAKLFQPMKIEADGSHLLKVWEKAKTYSNDAPLEIYYEIALEYLKAGPRGEEAHWASAKYDTRPKLPLIKCPTLVLSGRDDVFFPVVDEIRNLVPRARSIIIDGEGTGPAGIVRIRPEAFAEAILDFLLHPDV